MPACSIFASAAFQSAPLCRGDMMLASAPPFTPGFNPRPCVGATMSKAGSIAAVLFQSAPLCRGDGNLFVLRGVDQVSIRAPV